MRPIEVIWTTSAFTDATNCNSELKPVSVSHDDINSFHFALESDLFDSAVIDWNGQQSPTLEVIPGFKKDDKPESELDDRYVVETVLSGRLDDKIELPSYLEEIDTSTLQAEKGNEEISAHGKPIGGLRPFQVRRDGIEHPLYGWKPTGVVFFETISIPERKVVYSSMFTENTLQNSSDQPKLGTDISDVAREAFNAIDQNRDDSFFNYPDHFPTNDPFEITDRHYVIKSNSGFFGGFFRKFFFLLFLILGLFVAVGICVLGIYGYYAYNRMFINSSSGNTGTLVIKPNETFNIVLNRMQKEKLIGSFMGVNDKYLLKLLAYSEQNANQIKPGAYKIDTKMSLKSIYSEMIKGSTDYKITIPEGKSAAEVAAEVKKTYETFDDVRFLELVKDPEFTKKMGIEADSLEGYLYPSTYYFGPGMKEEELIKLMVGTFKQKVDENLGGMTTDDGLTFQAHVIIASLIEREARTDEDRPAIASVIFNRLSKGIPLQIDATVNYALNDWRRLFNSDYKLDHPYNTYKFKGLPPGPIASPRIESLMATFNTPETNYFYYVHRGDGHHAFAETYEQHLANVGRYIRSNKADGTMGNEPIEQNSSNNDAGPQVDSDPQSVSSSVGKGKHKSNVAN